MPEPEFVTISRASQLLGVNERSARRAVGQLSDTDRQAPDKGPQLVRLAALASQMGKPLPVPKLSDKEPDLSDSAGQVSDTQGGLSDKAPDSRAPVSDTSDLVEQLRGEVEYLRSALAASQQIASQAQQLQLLAERRVGELEGKLLPAHEATGTGQELRSGTPDGSQSSPVASGGGIVPPSTSEEPTRPWWVLPMFWKGK